MPAGSALDIATRAIAEQLAARWGQQVLIEADGRNATWRHHRAGKAGRRGAPEAVKPRGVIRTASWEGVVVPAVTKMAVVAFRQGAHDGTLREMAGSDRRERPALTRPGCRAGTKVSGPVSGNEDATPGASRSQRVAKYPQGVPKALERPG